MLFGHLLRSSNRLDNESISDEQEARNRHALNYALCIFAGVFLDIAYWYIPRSVVNTPQREWKMMIPLTVLPTVLYGAYVNIKRNDQSRVMDSLGSQENCQQAEESLKC